jgi:putative transposase
MTEEEKRDVASFRFGVIHDLVNRMDLDRGEQEHLIEEKRNRRWKIPFSERSAISRTTILRWMRLYKESNGKIESLYPHDRSDRGKSRAMDGETVLALIGLRHEFPGATIKELVSKMGERGLARRGLSASTVYRLLTSQGIMRLNGEKGEDRRKFEAEQPNDIWQSDVMHGPGILVGEKVRKSYLVAILDDHSRLLVHGEFYGTEGLDSYLDAFEKALLRRGLPRRLYTDNGAAFRSRHLEHICASLGIALIHARPYKPQGKGKIERFFRSVRASFLSVFEGKTMAELNESFTAWLREYHERRHHSTGQPPFERFTSKMECLRPAPSNLRDHFRKCARRRVSMDRTVILNGRLFEAPIQLIGKRVELLFHEGNELPVEIFLNGISYGFLPPVDLHVNCRVKRDKSRNARMIPSGETRYRGGSLLSAGSEERS